MKINETKRFISFLLVVVMLFGMMPTTTGVVYGATGRPSPSRIQTSRVMQLQLINLLRVQMLSMQLGEAHIRGLVSHLGQTISMVQK